MAFYFTKTHILL